MTDFTYLPYLNKYEYAEAIGQRILEISNGSPITVNCDSHMLPRDIAIMEFKQKKSPIKIVRVFPDGRKEIFWAGSWLKAFPDKPDHPDELLNFFWRLVQH